MATLKEASDEDDVEERVLEKTIRKFRSLKKELFELSQPIDKMLERITQHEKNILTNCIFSNMRENSNGKQFRD